MWTTHQSTLVLFDAADLSATPVAIGRCKSGLELNTSYEETLADAFGDDTRTPLTTDIAHSITLTNILATDLTANGLVGPDPQPGARYTLVALAHDPRSGRWMKTEWYHVTVARHSIDSGASVAQVHGQNFTFNARRKVTFYGSSKNIPAAGGFPAVSARPLPDATPTPGIVIFHQASDRSQAFSYNFTGHSFSALEPSDVSITATEISVTPYTFITFSGSTTTLAGHTFVRQGSFNPAAAPAAPQNLALEFFIDGQFAAMLTANGDLHTTNLNVAPSHGLDIPDRHMRLGGDNMRLASTGTHIAGTLSTG